MRQIDWNKLEVSGEGADAAEVVDLLRGLPDPPQAAAAFLSVGGLFFDQEQFKISNIEFEFFIFFMFSCTRSA